MIIESWEIRYFSPGTVPYYLQQWVEEMNFVTQPVRTDYYLLTTGVDNGTKWREGNLQVKYLSGTFSLPDEQQGEHYKKWSFELKDDDTLKTLSNHNDWIGVTKKRDMAKWVYRNHKFHRTDLGNYEREGYELEVSALVCKEKLWWTIALEATGGKEILEKALEHINFELPNDLLNMGYARWLQQYYTKE